MHLQKITISKIRASESAFYISAIVVLVASILIPATLYTNAMVATKVAAAAAEFAVYGTFAMVGFKLVEGVVKNDPETVYLVLGEFISQFITLIAIAIRELPTQYQIAVQAAFYVDEGTLLLNWWQKTLILIAGLAVGATLLYSAINDYYDCNDKIGVFGGCSNSGSNGSNGVGTPKNGGWQ